MNIRAFGGKSAGDLETFSRSSSEVNAPKVT